jgi:hypothetical protein
MGFYSIFQGVLVVNIGIKNSVSDGFKQISCSPFEVGPLGNIVHNRRAGDKERSATPQVLQFRGQYTCLEGFPMVW